ncbi:MAG: hypothetical protein PVI53_02990, partial [Desulfobacteraceae bacterium]
KGLCLGRDDTFCQGLPGVNPQDQPTAMLSGIFFEISSFRNRPSLHTREIYDTAHQIGYYVLAR